FRTAGFYTGTRFLEAFQAPEGATGFRVEFQNRKEVGLSGQHLWVDRVKALVADTEESALYQAERYFDEEYVENPDPDLTPRARSGGGSQLVGTQVAGLTATGGVVVQSGEWSKSGGKSARFINNAGDDLVS